MSLFTTARTALARLTVALHTRRAISDVPSDAGMTTAEYAVGTVDGFCYG